MGLRIAGGTMSGSVALLALVVAASLPIGPEAAASSAVLHPAAVSSVGSSPPAVGPQVAVARARFATNVRMPHPGRPEALTHPAQDSTGSSLAAHRPIVPTSPRASPDQVSPASSSSQLGLDVANYQGNVNWGQVAADGASFAYVKATEGSYYSDTSYFPQQYNGSYSSGLVRGAYHFAVPNNSTGAAQADFFVANGGGWSPDGRTLPGMLDIEYNPYGAECYGLTHAQMVTWLTSFDNEYHALTSRWPDIYTNTDWWSTCTGNSGAFGQETLSIANWSGTPYALPNGWSNYTIWQYADSGLFPGDQDVLNGTHQDLVALALGQLNTDVLQSGQQMHSGQTLVSANGYQVVMQSDGNLVEYAPGNRALWSSRTSRRPGAWVWMQQDGNLVVYLGSRALWSTQTSSRGPSFLRIQTDANLVVYTNTGRATWASRGGRIR